MDKWQLTQMQNLPLEIKIEKTKLRLKEWYEYWNGEVYISFSGGKDSTVLLHIARTLYPDIECVFCDTGLEYPEVREFIKTFNDITWIKPTINFKNVIEKYGFPVISKEVSERIWMLKNYNLSEEFKTKLLNGKIPKKWLFLLDQDIKISHKCCNELKKKPFVKYERQTGKKVIMGYLAIESKLRIQKYLKLGCNSFESRRKISSPLSFWTENDVLEYIFKNKIKIPSVYGEIVKDNDNYYNTGCKRTGCIFCGFGAHLEDTPNRFQRLKKTHPKLYDYCIYKLNLKSILDILRINY